jgi:predicted RNA-binding protein with RPS1 domain
MTDTRRALLENFDADVHDRLRVHLMDTQEFLDRFTRMFWALSRFVLARQAEFDDHTLKFKLKEPPADGIPRGEYRLISKKHSNPDGAFLYRLSHPLGEYVIQTGLMAETPGAEVVFDITHHPVKLSPVQSLKGRNGWLALEQLTIETCDTEDYLLFSGFDDSGADITQEEMEKLFQCGGKTGGSLSLPVDVAHRLEQEARRHAQGVSAQSLERNNVHFNEAREQLYKWAEDMELAAQKDLQQTKEQIKGLSREARKAVTLQEQESIQLRIQELEKKKRRQRQNIFVVEDEIAYKRGQLIEDLEKKIARKVSCQQLFTIKWSVV